MMTSQTKDIAREIEVRLTSLPAQDTASIRSVRREFSRLLAKAPGQQVIELALSLSRRGSMTYRFIAYELVCHHREALSALGPAEILRLGEGIDSWSAVDCFCCFLAGPAWRQKQLPDRVIHDWALSADRWWRRAALVSTVPLNSRARGGTGDPVRTLKVCAMLTGDRDDMIVKALSWALRELSKRDPNSVRAFLAKHEKALAPRVIREVNNKLVTGLKSPRSRADS
jgi:3-methyladenine DNA glycosylase AlkD